jgi:hypothetical protein
MIMHYYLALDPQDAGLSSTSIERGARLDSKLNRLSEPSSDYDEATSPMPW